MDPRVAVPTDEFQELVRDALLHLYDLAYLQTHPLVTISGVAETGSVASGKLLRQAMLDAIGALHPGAGIAATSRAWRSYRILELRYVAGNEVEDVIEEVALSKRQYHREHNRALQAVASILWEGWQLANRWTEVTSRDGATAPSDVSLARLEAEHLAAESKAARIDPLEIVHGVASLLQPLCAARGITLRLSLPGHLPTVLGDRVALRQALLATLTQVVAAVGSGSVEVVALRRGRQVVIRIDCPVATHLESGQLGVDESRPFVEALGGDLSVSPPSSLPGHWIIDVSLRATSGPVLLVVDNSGDFITLVRRYLSDEGWEVVGASDVDEAYRLVLERPPRAILLDVVIPGRDGWDLLLELKKTPSTQDIPVLICSVLHESGMATSLGATAYLQKPIAQAKLLEALSRLP